MSRIPRPRYQGAVLTPLSQRFWTAGSELARIERYLPPVLRERIECELALFAQAIEHGARAVRLYESAYLNRLKRRPRPVRRGQIRLDP